MLKRRIIYAIWWIILILYFYFRAEMLSVVLMVGTLLLTVFTAFFASVNNKKITVSLKAPECVKPNENAIVDIEFCSNTKLPLFSGNMILTCEVKDTDEKQGLNVPFYLGFKDKCVVKAELSCNKISQLITYADEIECMDLFGVISFKKKLDQNDSLTIAVDEQEEAVDEPELVDDSKEIQTEHKEEDSTEQVQE